jgi:hypothetical protein
LYLSDRDQISMTRRKLENPCAAEVPARAEGPRHCSSGDQERGRAFALSARYAVSRERPGAWTSGTPAQPELIRAWSTGVAS